MSPQVTKGGIWYRVAMTERVLPLQKRNTGTPAGVPLYHIQNDILAQQLQHTGLGAGAYGLTHQLALLEYQQGGDAHHPELRR